MPRYRSRIRSRRLLCTIVLLISPLALMAQQSANPAGTVASVAAEGVVAPAAIDRFIAPLFAGYRAPQAQFAVDIYELRVWTRYPDGRPTQFRVQLFVPQMDRTPDGVYLFAPGSTGLIGPCRASREHVAGIRWGLYRAHVIAMAGQGFVGILPDYMGFEDPQLVQPYFHAASESRVIFDALTAVDTWIRDELPRGLADLRRVAAGFSQGGHAAFAAADRNLTAGGNLYLHGVIGYGPTTEIEPMLIRYPSLAPMVVMSYFTVYGRSTVDPFDILAREWAAELEYDTTRQCVGGMQSYYPSRASELLNESFRASLNEGTLAATHPVIARVFRANRTGLARHGVPALINQGTDDIVVSRKTQELYVEALQEVGNPVDYRLYEGARHDTRQIAFFDTLEWIRSLDPTRRPQQRSGPVRYNEQIDR